MAFTRLSFGKDWTKEADFSTHQDSEAQVRADLQYHPNAVRDFINDTLLKALEAGGAAESLGAVNGNGKTATVQSVLDEHSKTAAQLAEDIRTLSSGGMPDAVRSSEVEFGEDSWTAAADGVTLTIYKSDHNRENGSFGYNVYQRIANVYRSGTWAAAATRVAYNTGGSITLTADEAYAGKIVFFGL